VKETIDFSEFRILESTGNETVSYLPVDLPTCTRCASELLDKTNRRSNNPFISCALCGPRYTIMEVLPYDRHTTVMSDFPMCGQCNEEYLNITDRRFHAQTISCDDCGPELIYEELTIEGVQGLQDVSQTVLQSVASQRAELSKAVSQRVVLQKAVSPKAALKKAVLQKAALKKAALKKAALKKACDEIRSGGIIAVKGIGGYQFICSPFATDTLLNLRILKGREEKPFAVMFENIDSIREYAVVSVEEETLLKSKARPIVLLRYLAQKLSKEVNRGSLYLGAFLPYTPLQILLLKELGPLIMTSANLSGAPIIKDDASMFEFTSPFLKGILYHKRRIVRSVDDSVVKVVNQKTQLIRRSRGYVPAPILLSSIHKDYVVAGAGGDLKSTFCFYKGGNAVVSQYFGDLEEYSVLEEYKSSFADLSKMLHISPDYTVCDLHPNYHSSKFIRSLGVPIKYVQHHHAHIASVIAEHHLEGKVLGVAFDGTGYGTDGNVWGGEFLICEEANFSREAHLAYNTYLGGDDSLKDASKTATCLLLNAGLDEYVTDHNLNIIKAALNNKINTILSSSMGRLFDAASSILNICHRNQYEGECAILLENEALLAIEQQIEPVPLSFCIEEKGEEIRIEYKELLLNLSKEKEHKDKKALALGFHHAVADMTVTVCEILRKKEGIQKVALSGGVFQNAILLERVYNGLSERGFQVYTNNLLPPNDSSISLGQVFLGLIDKEI
jgi:hydrogenase maturation protein HypF